MTELKIFETPEEVAAAFAQQLYQLAGMSSGIFHLALSGGSTPILLFDHLAGDYSSRMPWDKIHFWWSDERCVPPAGDESNYKMTSERLLSRIPVKPEQIHRIKGELAPEQACREYQVEIREQLKIRQDFPVFDLIMLGIGEDGHTASIFPDQMDLLKANSFCEVATHPVSGQKRVSLTGKVLNNADRVFFLVTGKSKAHRVAQIIDQEDSANTLPAFHIRPSAGFLSFYLDREAASGIR